MLDENTCELNNICVATEKRHGNIGSALLENTFENARKAGYGKMTIGIVEENQILRKWYEKHGFVHTGTKKFDFFPFTCGYMEIDLN